MRCRDVLVANVADPQVHTASLYPAPTGWAWGTMWWARASHLAGTQAPHNALFRHYYEEWIGRRGCLDAEVAAKMYNNNFTELETEKPTKDHHAGSCGFWGVANSFSSVSGHLNSSYMPEDLHTDSFNPPSPYSAKSLFAHWNISHCMNHLLSFAYGG
jgi:hypothetical protein